MPVRSQRLTRGCLASAFGWWVQDDRLNPPVESCHSKNAFKRSAIGAGDGKAAMARPTRLGTLQRSESA